LLDNLVWRYSKRRPWAKSEPDYSTVLGEQPRSSEHSILVWSIASPAN